MTKRPGLASLLSLCAVLLASYAAAHKGVKHPGDGVSVPTAPTGIGSPAADREGAMARINAAYLRQVKPIFLKKCFDCHGSGRPLPWYFAVPGAKHLMLYDMRTAKKHLDMRTGFPFGGHGSLRENLEALDEVVQDGSMPPWYYRVMHWDSALRPDEAALVRAWIGMAKKLLGTGEGDLDSKREPEQEVGK
ncbi:MAG: heme-binding domain-containing protein [Elusimicrobia bacterium]|nr:heme-binding domain-containing protein [Elusimicrobiota bacterium]